MTALIPYLFRLGALVAVATIVGTLRTYLPTIRAILREAIEGY